MIGLCHAVFDLCKGTYYVPTTLLVLSSVWLPSNIFSIPKSDIFGFISASSRILLHFKSLWMILNLESWWRYKIPRAIPTIISKRFRQSNSNVLVSSVNKITLSASYNLTTSVKHGNKQKKTYQKERSPSFCLASIHRLTFFLHCECNNLEVSQDFCVEALQLP